MDEDGNKNAQLGRGNFRSGSKNPSDGTHDDNSSYDNRKNEQLKTPRREPSLESRFVISPEREIDTLSKM